MKRPTIEQQVTFLATRDLRANAAFYEDVLGLALVLDQGVCRIYQTGKAAFLGFCEHLPLTVGEVQHLPLLHARSRWLSG